MCVIGTSLAFMVVVLKILVFSNSIFFLIYFIISLYNTPNIKSSIFHIIAKNYSLSLSHATTLTTHHSPPPQTQTNHHKQPPPTIQTSITKIQQSTTYHPSHLKQNLDKKQKKIISTEIQSREENVKEKESKPTTSNPPLSHHRYTDLNSR